LPLDISIFRSGVMKIDESWKKIEEILDADDRYKANAYIFVIIAVERAVSSLPEPRHISGGELLRGIADYATEQFGPMAKQVFNFWGIKESLDFGNIVFNLTDKGLLLKTDEDTIDDFRDGFDFKKVFEDDYFER
jgi:uncharacterized repeat protein (TIGR04138 family)